MFHRAKVAGILLLLFGFTLSLYSQEDFQRWLQQEQDAFTEFRDERDQAFTEFLENDWEEFQASRGLVRDPAPKPDIVPEAEPEDIPEPEVVTDTEIPEISLPEPLPPREEPEPEPEPIPAGTSVKVDFYGTGVRLTYDDAIRGAIRSNIDNTIISDYWRKLGTSNYEPLLSQLQTQKSRLNLNDWGYALFINKAGQTIYPSSPNTSTLFTWFYLLKSGYTAKVGYGSGTVYLLLPAENTVFDVPFLSFEGERYYIIPFDGETPEVSDITTYDGDYPGTDKVMNFHIETSPVINTSLTRRTYRFKYLDENFTLPITLNKNIVNFYSHYPQTDIPIYFEANLSERTAKEMLNGLKDMIEGKPETRAVNILLRFVQTGFNYQTDRAQFGTENYLFPEETLYYPACDCEDRAALFAYLVRSMLGLEVVGLDYPGHIATAVRFSRDVGRDYVTYNGKKYTVCDPTYIRAEYGMTMPSAKGKQVSVFQIP